MRQCVALQFRPLLIRVRAALEAMPICAYFVQFSGHAKSDLFIVNGQRYFWVAFHQLNTRVDVWQRLVAAEAAHPLFGHTLAHRDFFEPIAFLEWRQLLAEHVFRDHVGLVIVCRALADGAQNFAYTHHTAREKTAMARRDFVAPGLARARLVAFVLDSLNFTVTH